MTPCEYSILCAPGAENIGKALERVMDTAAPSLMRRTGSTSATIVVVCDAAPASVRVVAHAGVRTPGRMLVVVDETKTSPWSLHESAALLRAGAEDVIEWNGGAPEPIQTIVARLGRWAEVDWELVKANGWANAVGRSVAWRRAVLETAEEALFGRLPVLFTGESGTGKEVLARLAHTLDRRSPKGELIVLDCTTLLRDLAGSELFGHERGAYTGATTARAGAVELADGGTLFLDEVGELPLDVQVQLLRVLQDREYKRVGGTTWARSAFRLVCATNRDLEREVDAGRFRRDLYHRLAGGVIRTPALRDRGEDVLELAQYFLREALGPSASAGFSTAVQAYLRARSYPGNVRELRQLVGVMARRHVGAGPVGLGAFPESEIRALTEQAIEVPDWRSSESLRSLVRTALSSGAELKEIGRATEEEAIRVTIEEFGSLRLAAVRLGMSERALQLRRAAERSSRGEN